MNTIIRSPLILKRHQLDCVAAAADAYCGQFIYPTGTGKTIAEAAIIADHIERGDHGIYVVLVPRILLANQIYSELYLKLVIGKGIDCSFFSLHSGDAPSIAKIAKKLKLKDQSGEQDDENDMIAMGKFLRDGLGLSERQCRETFGQGTTIKKLREAVDKAEDQGRPLIIVSTYHSSERLALAFEETEDRSSTEASMLIADEAHYAVTVGFSHIHEMPAAKRFYFTATMRVTDGDNGLGQNNFAKFGPVLDELSPAEAVVRGLVVRPRVHYVMLDDVTDETEVDADFKAVEASFEAHAKEVGGIGAKFLVAARGTMEIRQMMEASNFFERLRITRPGLKVFDISSAYGARVNGSVCKRRDEFLEQLQNLSDKDEAIIVHYDILSEGIDVPGITGVMPLRALGVAKFLQTVGRATRLHPTDRKNLDSGKIDAARLDWFIKKYAWIVLPCYGTHGSDIESAAEKYVDLLRTFGWTPKEVVLSTQEGGEVTSSPIDEVHEDDKKLAELAEYVGSIHQRFENLKAAEEAYRLVEDLI